MAATLGRGALRWILLSALLLLTCLPRFNLRDPGPIKQFTAKATATQYGLPLDVEGYRRLTEFYRGNTPADSLIPPFCYRPLVPFVASVLPFDALTSINIVDIASLFLAVLVLDRLLRRLGYELAARTVGDAVFIVSFPTFYYGAIGFVDPAAVLLVTLGILLTLRGNAILLALCVVLATLVKETSALLALLPGIWSWARGSFTRRAAAQVAVLAAGALATVLLVRILSPFSEPGWFLAPRLKSILLNLSRPRAILSLLLTLGLPAAFSIVSVLRGTAEARLGRPLYRFFVCGAGLVGLLYAYTLVGAYADGRIVWVIYPFLIPLALTAWWSPSMDHSAPAVDAASARVAAGDPASVNQRRQ